MQSTSKKSMRSLLAVALLAVFSLFILAACSEEPDDTPTQQIPAYGPKVSISMPDSLTGGTSGSGSAIVAPTALSAPSILAASNALVLGGSGEKYATGTICSYVGSGTEDPFKNGYNMTRFMVGTVAAWTCIADQIIGFIDLMVFYGVPTNGTPVPFENAGTPVAGEATGIIIDTVTTPGITEVFVYYDAFTGLPDTPTPPANAGMYITWSNTGDITGKLIIDAIIFTDWVAAESPDFLRVDFGTTATQKTGEMMISFNAANPWANDFRIQVTKNLDGTAPIYTALSIVDLNDHWDTSINLTPLPSIAMKAVADGTGNGAAVAQMQNIAVNLGPLDDGDHLGLYQFTKDDTYYFTSAMGAEYINKTVTSATYDSGLSFNGTGWLTTKADFDVWLDSTLGYSFGTNTYSTCTGTPGTPQTACEDFLNLVFSGDTFGAEANLNLLGDITLDSRYGLLNATTIPTSTCPADAGTCTMDSTDVYNMVP